MRQHTEDPKTSSWQCTAGWGSTIGSQHGCVSQAMQSQGISHAVQLEQWLMEGAYNKVLEARPQLPHPAYSYFMEKLLSTVR